MLPNWFAALLVNTTDVALPVHVVVLLEVDKDPTFTVKLGVLFHTITILVMVFP